MFQSSLEPRHIIAFSAPTQIVPVLRSQIHEWHLQIYEWKNHLHSVEQQETHMVSMWSIRQSSDRSWINLPKSIYFQYRRHGTRPESCNIFFSTFSNIISIYHVVCQSKLKLNTFIYRWWSCNKVPTSVWCLIHLISDIFNFINGF